MLFNSYTFLLAYLPVTVLGFFLAARWGKYAGAVWLAVASLFFYGWWDTRYLLLLAASIVGNYLAGSLVSRHPGTRKGRGLLALSIAANLGLLAYYKYADFFLASINTVLGTSTPLLGIILPIGISFFTFTQIAFLADAYFGKVREYRFVHYVLFVTYFPHLIAGPVLHHKEMMPQFDDDRNYRADAANFAIGLTIFAIGLAKKVLIADNLAVYASPVFAPQTTTPELFYAWGGTLAYTFQLYFDFSGYSDMAIGLSRLFGVRLPLNFDSPYKSANIADFWRRWHMTLSRFLRDYLYFPLGGSRCGLPRRLFNLMVTMVLGGLWHGAGWTFVVWGALHGLYLALHQVWRHLTAGLRRPWPPAGGRMLATATTFIAVVFSWAYFRAPDIDTANHIVIGMLGGGGVAMPDAILSRLGPVQDVLTACGIRTYLGGGGVFFETWAWVVASALIAFLAPNTQEIMGRFEPSLPAEGNRPQSVAKRLSWQPTRRYAFLTGILFGCGVLALSRPTEFLYFQF